MPNENDALAPFVHKDEHGEYQIAFDFVKGALHRVIHVDGCFGGLSPGGSQIVMSLYAERSPIPRRVVHRLEMSSEKQAKMGDEVSRDTRDAVIREVDVTLAMNRATARTLGKWLLEKTSSEDDS